MFIRYLPLVVVVFVFASHALGQTPKYLHPFRDSGSGFQIVRVTNPEHPICMGPVEDCDPSLLTDNGTKMLWQKVSRHHYSKTNAWNADETLMYATRGAERGWVFMDGHSYEPLFIISPYSSCKNSERQGPRDPTYVWHPHDPDLLVFVETEKVKGTVKRIGHFNVHTRCIVWAHSFSGFQYLNWGDGNRGKPTSDGLIWPLQGIKDDGTRVGFLAYLRPDGKGGYHVDTSPEIELTQFLTDQSLLEGERYSFGVSPLGNFVVVGGCIKGHRDPRCAAMIVLTPNGREVWRELDYHVPGHGDYLIDGAGVEWMIGLAKANNLDDNGNVIDKIQGHTIKRRFSDGNIVDIGPYPAMHTSCRAHLAPVPLCVLTFSRIPWGEGSGIQEIEGISKNRWDELSGTVTLLNADSGAMLPVAHHNGVLNGYVTEMHGSISPSGTRVVFASNWGDGEGDVASYVVEIPDDQIPQ